MIATILLTTICLCGEAPERANDFYWENDRVGFRAYGPGDVHKWSGIDVFNKNTSSNVVHSWLRRLGPRCNWHKNVNGLGMDDYAVGPGRGVGGVALRKDGEWLPDYGNWVAYRVVTNGDARCAFELDYKLPIGGTMTLAIALERGKSLFREAVSFSPDTPLAGVEVGVGLDLNVSRLHGGDVWTDDRRGIVSLFEKPHVDKEGRPVPGEEGVTMSAVVALKGFHALTDEPQGAKMLMTKPLTAADANGRPVLEVLAGADWSEAGRFTSAEAWHGSVQNADNAYLDLMEAAVSAYTDEHLAAYLADVERDGVQEHGFPRLAANLGILVANGRLTERKSALERMMTACCRDARKGKMPPKSGGNEFSVKELVLAVAELERTAAFPKPTIDGWKSDLSAIVAEDCYTLGRLEVGARIARNWVVFAAASEQARICYGFGGNPVFVEKYVKDQLRWFDANGMYRDPNQPAVYDFVTRLQFMHILDWGFDGPSRAEVEAQLEKSAEPTLAMLSACGEIPYGGRSNQFLHNHTFYAAVCAWYAAQYAKRGDAAKAGRFAAAARQAMEAILPWLAETPVSHVKNRYPREAGKGVYSEKGDMGCERYAYFDKYMVTMGSWAMSGWCFAKNILQNVPQMPIAVEPSVFVTTPDFHFVFLSAGDYSAQFDYNADTHYDCDGLGRVQRRGAPSTLCLSTPCAEHPNYRIETPNDAPLAIVPVVPDAWSLRFDKAYTDGPAALATWTLSPTNAPIKQSNNQTVKQPNSLSWTCRLSPEGVASTLTGDGALALTLPAFAFDGREETQIEATEKTLTVIYRGWKCVYETDGTIVDTGRSACNRNGRYRRFEARGRNRLNVRISLEAQ